MGLHVLMLAFLVLVPFPVGDSDAAAKDLAKFQGEWIPTVYIVDGKTWTEAERKSIHLSVKGNVSTFKRHGDTGRGTYTLDPTTTPKSLDIAIMAGKSAGKIELAIYTFDGEILKVCLAAPGQPRPKDFVSRAGSGHNLEVWKRVRP